MTQKKLKVAIAGYGIVGKRRQKFIDEHPLFETIAVCDQYFETDGQFDDGIRYFKNYKDLFSLHFDVLFVCVPNFLAPEITMAGLEAKKHVFCEKPPGRTVQDIENVIKIANQNPSLKLKYGFNHRYHDSVQKALSVISGGDFGKVINLRGVYGKSKIIPFSGGWRAKREVSGGGILLDQGIHMVDLMRLFAGEEFTSYQSIISNDYWQHDVEDNAYALMKTDQNVVAILHSSATYWRHKFHLDITLEKGTITLSGLLTGSKSYGAEKIIIAYKSNDDNGDPKETTIKYNEDVSWREEIKEFADCIENNKDIVYGSAQDALNTMKTVYQIYCADENWKQKYALTF